MTTATTADRQAATTRLFDLDYWYALDRSGEGYKMGRLQLDERRALTIARQWEAFADCTPQQLEAAVTLLVATRRAGDVNDLTIDREDAEYVACIAKVLSLAGGRA